MTQSMNIQRTGGGSVTVGLPAPTTVEELQRWLHSMRIRARGNKALSTRLTILHTGVGVLARPRDTPDGHYRHLAVLRRTARELDQMLGGTAPWLLEWKPRVAVAAKGG